jgi:catechol 2,3-dioxygenase-like lactoylglutathione lyase family enzyme
VRPRPSALVQCGAAPAERPVREAVGIRVANINGMAHIQLTVSDMKRSVPFYDRLLHSLGMVTIVDTPEFHYCVGGRTGVAISPASSELRARPFQQWSPGLHHFCFRTRSREDVDDVYQVALDLSAKIIHAPREGAFAPGYYSVLFEDPDGIRIEANFVPGKGHLEPGAKLPFNERPS